MTIPSDLFFTKGHEWVRITGDSAEIGITDYAQGELGDIVFVELPESGSNVKKDEPFGTIEAVKAVSELFSPITGTVEAVNSLIDDDAGLINRDPYGEGWMIRIRMTDPGDTGNLLSGEQYEELIEE